MENVKVGEQGIETLDPADWEEFRALAHGTMDRVIDYLRDVRERPVWSPVPDSVEPLFNQPPPYRGTPLVQVLDDVYDRVLPYPTGNIHPRFWGWVSGAGSPSGLLAELLGAAVNPVAGNFNDAASRLEAQVLDWMRVAFGFPEGSSGVIVSGGSVANLVGLAVGRDTHGGGDTVEDGVAAAPGRLVFYGSADTHSSVDKAAQVLGLGRTSLRRVPVDDGFRIRIDALERMIVLDRSRGLHPFALVGNAGSINVGAVDDLDALADLAQRERLWFHVDGAFGALAALSPALAGRVAGMERADSLAFDFHKWLSVPYEAGCVLIRNRERHLATFSVPADYLVPLERGTSATHDAANLRGLQLSRGFKSLKIWMTLREHGLETFGRIIERNVADAEHVARRADASPDLELLAPVALNVVCFRYRPAGVRDESLLDAWNREILMRVQERGIAVPSSTVVGGRFALRIANVNHRSTRADFDHALDEIVRLGHELRMEAGATPGSAA